MPEKDENAAPVSNRFIRALNSAKTAKEVVAIGNEYAGKISGLDEQEIRRLRAAYRNRLSKVD